jgi:hypothetical protein
MAGVASYSPAVEQAGGQWADVAMFGRHFRLRTQLFINNQVCCASDQCAIAADACGDSMWMR